MKSAWRLGKTILGVVELNDREVGARILKAGTQLTLGPDLSAMLEAYESLPSDLTAPPSINK
ncbi:hypothetical protein BGY98DRAFT_1092817 [Russula aff. rugulosa BPL654]|nr:hypothetical protein BGY98DRAFT_1092817 [Russula aff. rugulosa BPL654]